MHIERKPFSGLPPKTELTEEKIVKLREKIVANVASDTYLDYANHYGFDRIKCQHTVTTLPVDIHGKKHQLLLNRLAPLSEPHSIVCVFHGLFDHSGLYADFIKPLLENQCVIYIVDFPGFGLSDGERTKINTFNDYALCASMLNKYAKSQYPSLPIYGIAHSTGATALLGSNWPFYNSEDPNDNMHHENVAWDKIVLLAPLVYPKGWLLVQLLLFFGGGVIKHIKRLFISNSHDKAFIKFIESHDPLQSRYLSVAWVRAMKQWVRVCKNHTASKQVWPCSHRVCIIQGGKDKTVDATRNISLFKQLFPDHQLHIVPKAKHHLVNESKDYRTVIQSKIKAFLFGLS